MKPMPADFLLIKALVFILCFLLIACIEKIAASDPASSIESFLAREKARGGKANRLLNEKSPYLLQHAFNPVDWYPWGEEAFARARREKKLVFLSIGYSTCHWCHVMAHETFEHPDVAAILNRYFICIKVDREERPDIDRTYMAVALALNGQGGWPLSVFLTPDMQPFYAGTYFPPEERPGLPGFLSILQTLHKAWETDPENINRNAAALMAAVRERGPGESAVGIPGQQDLDREFAMIGSHFDRLHGGFGQAPKFPRPVLYDFLLRYYAGTGNRAALDMTLQTLRSMAGGGMYDQVGGGFHRYSVDAQWRVPHFEKMLYDQAQLAVSFLQTLQISGDSFFADTARGTLDYVRTVMTAPQGGFYSAEDADSPDPAGNGKKEGAFYAWTYDEIVDILGPDTARLFAFYYGVEKDGNVRHDPHGEFPDKNILYIAKSVELTGQFFGMQPDEAAAKLAHARRQVMAARQARPRPHLDDKIITSWNGLMISAFAKAFQVLGGRTYLAAATNAAEFIMTRLYDRKTGTLMRRYRGGEAGLDAQLTDYAFLVQGLLDLYESSFDSRWLAHAIELTEKQIAVFHDAGQGAFFDNPGTDTILLRTKEDYDGALPTGNSVTAMNLLRLAQMIDNKKWRDLATNTFMFFSATLEQHSGRMPQLLSAVDFQLKKPKQIIIAGRPGAEDTQKLLQTIFDRYLPNKVLLLADDGPGQKLLAGYLPTIKFNRMLKGRATAYVCENYTCEIPVTETAELIQQLEN